LETIISAQNLWKIYKKEKIFGQKEEIVAVKNFNLDIKRNEIIGIVGESGSGKSTVSRLLLGIEKPTKGRVIFFEKDLFSLKSAELKKLRKKTQYIFQNPYSSLNPRLTIGKSIEEPLIIHEKLNKRERKEKVLKILEEVGLKKEYYTRFPHQLSGGQCQRVVIARALILQPQFVIADEPTSSLDVSIQAQILNLLKKIHEKFSLTMIFISHDLNVVNFISDRIVVMYKGEIVEIAEKDEFFKAPKNPYSKKLLEALLE